MTLDGRQSPRCLGEHRRAFAEDPESAVIAYARALNSVALDQLSTTGPNNLYDEAEAALEQTIEEHGATPARVTHLVKILINDAQANAFSSGPNWPDQGRALDAAKRAVRWHEELVDHMSALRGEVSAEDRLAVLSNAINAHLTLARVWAACALGDEAQDSFGRAAEISEAHDFEDEWGDILRSVGQEVGVDLESYGGKLAEEDRTAAWYWYGP